ncbi:MAG: PEP-CTERM sorting domain-containing protein [Planctomycetota bacterium]
MEFFLGGSSSFASAAIGKGYNQQLDLRNLSFSYALSDGQQLTGSVVYSTGGATPRAVPEPSALALLAGMTAAALWSGREKTSLTP